MQALITQRNKATQQLFFFASIGTSAALAHLFIVLYLVNRLDLQPLVANVIAFFIAFNISYLGHRNLTFAQVNNDKQLRLPYFFLVATSAGLLNESLYYLLLNYTDIHYLLALILVLALVAVYSFLLARFWACR